MVSLEGSNEVASKTDKKTLIERLTLLTALLAIATSTTSLVFTLYPTLKPPEKIGGSIIKTDIVQQIRYAQYRSDSNSINDLRSDTSSLGNSLRESNPLGLEIFTRIELSGHATRRYVVTSRLYRVATLQGKDAVVGPAVQQYTEFADLTPKAGTESLSFQLFQATENISGKFMVRIELFDLGDNQTKTFYSTDNWNSIAKNLLDYVDTETFSLNN